MDIIMTNSAINQQFLAGIDAKISDEIVSAIASHYGITKVEALAQVTQDEAEHLLDYLNGHIRHVTSLLMRQQGFTIL